MGLIDVLTQYDTKKKAAHAAKAVKHGVRDQASVLEVLSTQSACFTAPCCTALQDAFTLRILSIDQLCLCVFSAGGSRNLHRSPRAVRQTFQRVHRQDLCLA